MKNTLCLFGMAALLFGSLACSSTRERNFRENLSGPHLISRYQWIKRDASGAFSQVVLDTTNLATLLLWDNESTALNNLTYIGSRTPAGWYYGRVGVGKPALPIGWYADYEEKASLTVWSEGSVGDKTRITYTLETKNYYQTLHLEAVFDTPDGEFKEVMDWERTKP